MASSTGWRQNSNWRIRVPLEDRRDNKPATNPNPAHASRVWRRVDGRGTSDTHERGPRRLPGPPGNAMNQPAWTESADTISQGRRIYLGNILYRIKPDKIEEMLAMEGFGEEVESTVDIHISVDPVTGRNPGYCFIDFKTGSGEQTALESLTDISIQGRPVKVGPCQPKRVQPVGRSDDYTPTFQQWGDWKGPRQSDPAGRHPGDEGIEQGRYVAIDHIDAVRKADVPARVYFGELGKMINQYENGRPADQGLSRQLQSYRNQQTHHSSLVHTRRAQKSPETTIAALSI